VRATGERIGRQVKRLTRLLEDLTDASRIHFGKVRLDRRRVDLREVIGQAVESVDPHLRKAGHTLIVSRPDDPLWLDADPHRLTQVVENLLTNAIKYTPPRGRVWVTAEADGEAEAVVRVRDSGVGIPADRLESVFELFAQNDRRRGEEDAGLGIGLAVVGELVALHGGTVRAASDGDGHGSEFVVRLPVACQGCP
jgi:signal transduction histidine kinase